MTLSYCSLSCWSSASRSNERCCSTEKVPRMPQATATVSEMARTRRAEIDRSLNMGNRGSAKKEGRGKSQKLLKNTVDCGPVVLRARAMPDEDGWRRLHSARQAKHEIARDDQSRKATTP